VRIIGVLAWLALVTSLSAATLSNPSRVGTGFEFSVTGESNAIYAIEASSDLQNWTRLSTNRLFGEVRTIQISSSAQEEFYRIRALRPLFTAALAVYESIDFAGSGVTVVSFDSRDPRYFLPNGSLDATRVSDRADITTSSSLTNSLNLGNAKVYGHVRAPRDGVLVLGPGGAVGSILWHLNVGQGIQEGWYAEVTPRVFVDAELPGGVYVTPGPGSVDGTNYTYVLSNGHYTLPGLTPTSMLVTGRATLHVAGSAQVGGRIVIMRNASLDLYVGGPSAAINFSAVSNENRDPTTFATAFAYYGLPGNTNVAVGVSGSCAGTFYAPAAKITFGGGGNDEVDFIGAVVGRNIKVYGKMTVRYDEALGIAGPAW
jgi:hypothetical protein